MSEASRQFWSEYFGDVAMRDTSWLDYSNARVQMQSLALCVEAAGDLSGRSCLDVGCGHGQLAMVLKSMGASPVVASDLVPALIEKSRRLMPEIDWRQGDIGDSRFLDRLPAFDRIFMVEVLQYVEVDHVIGRIWSHLNPGGRLIGIVPNRDCPIVSRTVTRLKYYRAIDPCDLKVLAGSLPDLEFWGLRGLTFAADQRLVPYEVDRWSSPRAPSCPPNRLNFVLVKAAPSNPAASPREDG